MGHERIAYLPKTKKWRNIVAELSEYSEQNNNVASLASNTTKNVADRLKIINKDAGVIASFTYLITLIKASQSKNPIDFLLNNGIQLPSQFTPLDLARSIKKFSQIHEDNKEYGVFATQALIDTISIWLRQQNQISFVFNDLTDPFEPWKKAANGGGFTEISRIYFSNFISRYLRYFLEREASSQIKTLSDREGFNKKLEEQVQDISKTAFATTKVTQQFGAGWYNSHAVNNLPSEIEIRGYIEYAFKKLSNNLMYNLEVDNEQ